MRLALYCIKHVSRYARNVLYDCAMLLGSTSTQDQARLRSLGLRRRSWCTTPGSRSCCTRAARRPATRTSLWRARRRSFLKLWRRTEWFDFFCLSDSVFFFYLCQTLSIGCLAAQIQIQAHYSSPLVCHLLSFVLWECLYHLPVDSMTISSSSALHYALPRML